MTTDSGHEARRENFPVPTTRRLPYKLHEAAVRYVSASSVLGSNWKAADVNLVEVGIPEKHVPHKTTAPDSASLADAGDARHVDRLEDLCVRLATAKIFPWCRHFHAISTQTPAARTHTASPLSLTVL